MVMFQPVDNYPLLLLLFLVLLPMVVVVVVAVVAVAVVVVVVKSPKAAVSRMSQGDRTSRCWWVPPIPRPHEDPSKNAPRLLQLPRYCAPAATPTMLTMPMSTLMLSMLLLIATKHETSRRAWKAQQRQALALRQRRRLSHPRRLLIRGAPTTPKLHYRKPQ